MALRVAGSVVALGLVVWFVDLFAMLSTLRSTRLESLVAVLGLVLVGILLNVKKWVVLLQACNSRMHFLVALQLYWTGLFFNNLLPGRTGGDVIRVIGAAQSTGNRAGAVISVAVDRGLNLLALLLLVIIGWSVADESSFGFQWRWIGGIAPLLCLFVGILLFLSRRQIRVWVLTRPALRSFVGQVWQAVLLLVQRRAVVVWAFGIALVFQSSMILSNYVVARAYGYEVPLPAMFYLIPLTALITMVPVSLNGFGLREAAYVVALGSLGIPAESAVAISLTVTLCVLVMSCGGLVCYLLSNGRRRPLRAKTQKDLVMSSPPIWRGPSERAM